jgi:hypothetical protein
MHFAQDGGVSTHRVAERKRKNGLPHGNVGRRKRIWSDSFDDVRVARLDRSNVCWRFWIRMNTA